MSRNSTRQMEVQETPVNMRCANQPREQHNPAVVLPEVLLVTCELVLLYWEEAGFGRVLIIRFPTPSMRPRINLA